MNYAAALIGIVLSFSPSEHLPYGNPYVEQCNPKELNMSVGGVPGLYCAPQCNVKYQNDCPPGKPAGTVAMPECMIAVNGSSTNNYCALICNTDAKVDQCDSKGGAACHHIQGNQGVCTYTNSSTQVIRSTAGVYHTD
jgi:hypothetical protein